MQWDEVSEDGYLTDLNIAQPLRYDPFPSIQEDYSDRIEDSLSEVDLEVSVMGGVQNFTTSSLALHAMQEYGVTMQVEEDKARIANPRGWPVSKDDLRSLKKDIELRIFQISEEQQRLELKDRWKSHYNEFTSRSVDGDETALLYRGLVNSRLHALRHLVMVAPCPIRPLLFGRLQRTNLRRIIQRCHFRRHVHIAFEDHDVLRAVFGPHQRGHPRIKHKGHEPWFITFPATKTDVWWDL